ncbi:hypothetical protein [Zobellia uliginosa]|uniref:hypothetical protein n=1 Tax=Zobellia uliginosa TaxID=143224 RepID=UPI0026E1523D|nr:hypothetical protein [Zobellia uliginosa]MDO6517292.1 hypothetical protein [Zobellia uliginosa]
MTTIERVFEVAEHYNHAISAFEKKLGLSNMTLIAAKKNKASVKDTVLNKVFEVFPEVDPVWLLTGEGKMLRRDNVPDVKAVADYTKEFDRIEKALARLVLDVGEILENQKKKKD